MEKSSAPRKYFIRVSTDIYALTKVQEWFQQIKEIPPKVWLQCNLILAEGFTNVVCHAHEHLPENTPIEIEAIAGSNFVELRIWDYGKPFDLRSELTKQSQKKKEFTYDEIDEIPTGGRGLMITDSIADQFSYTRTFDNRNCFMIRKNYEDA